MINFFYVFYTIHPNRINIDVQRLKYMVLKQSKALLDLPKIRILKAEQINLDRLFLYLIFANFNSRIIQHR